MTKVKRHVTNFYSSNLILIFIIFIIILSLDVVPDSNASVVMRKLEAGEGGGGMVCGRGLGASTGKTIGDGGG